MPAFFVNRHFAQLHRDPQALTDAVTSYVKTGLRRGNGGQRSRRYYEESLQ